MIKMEIYFKQFFKEELSIDDIQVAMDQGEITSKELVMFYVSNSTE
jgi:amidase